jgi:hypothetical protein
MMKEGKGVENFLDFKSLLAIVKAKQRIKVKINLAPSLILLNAEFLLLTFYGKMGFPE